MHQHDVPHQLPRRRGQASPGQDSAKHPDPNVEPARIQGLAPMLVAAWVQTPDYLCAPTAYQVVKANPSPSGTAPAVPRNKQSLSSTRRQEAILSTIRIGLSPPASGLQSAVVGDDTSQQEDWLSAPTMGCSECKGCRRRGQSQLAGDLSTQAPMLFSKPSLIAACQGPGGDPETNEIRR